jgi:YVTN family beta-propeller protein
MDAIAIKPGLARGGAMKSRRRTFIGGIIGVLFAALIALPLAAQNVVGTISRTGLQPWSMTVYEGGNKLFVADANSGHLLNYDCTTLSLQNELTIPGGIPLRMMVRESTGMLYYKASDGGFIVVVDAKTNSFVKTIDFNPVSIILDQELGRLYALKGTSPSLYSIDLATDAVSSPVALSTDAGLWSGFALNPVTHEVFVSWLHGDVLDVIDGVTMARTTVPFKKCWAIEVNWLENKVYATTASWGGYWIYDRDTGTGKLTDCVSDSTILYFNPGDNRVYTDSEVNGETVIIDGPTDGCFKIPMRMATTTLEARYATNHVYFVNPQFIGILDGSTQMVEQIQLDPLPDLGGQSVIAVNQKTGRVFAVCDYVYKTSATITVIQDTDSMTRPPVFLGNSGASEIQLLDPVTKIISSDNFYPISERDQLAVSPGGGRLYQATYFDFYIYAGTNGLPLEMFKIQDSYSPVPDLIVPVAAPAGDRVYAAYSAYNNVKVVELATKSVIATIPVGTLPAGAAISPDGSRLYVANRGNNNISVIDTAANTVLKTIAVGTKPWGVAVNPAGTKVYVANSDSGTVSVIDSASGMVKKTITVGTAPHWLAISPDGRRAFVCNSGGTTVSVIDTGTDTPIRDIGVGGGPRGIVVLPDGTEIYVSTGTALTAIAASDYSTTAISLLPAPAGLSNKVSALAVADPTSRFAGRVTASGQPLAAAVVRALQGGAEKGRATSDASGDFCISNLKPGTYSIEFSAAGHATQTTAPQAVPIGRIGAANMDWDPVIASITVASPNGGEIWEPGSQHPVTWTSLGTVGEVKIEYSTNNGGSWTAAAASTPNDGSFDWTAPNTTSGQCRIRVSEAADGDPSDTSDAVFSLLSTKPTIRLSRSVLNFGVSMGGSGTSNQPVMITNTGAGTLNWTATPAGGGITATPGSGTGAGSVSIGVNAAGLAAGAYSGSIIFTDPNATNSPQALTVNFRVYPAGGTALPVGEFATPVDGTTGVTGAIPVTGWVLDDIETTKVEIWRDPVLSAGEVNSLYFIGTAIFVEGARPDVEAAYPTYPFNYKAGWGYMLLTNFLPAQGNGTFKLYAIATDKEGNVFTLGSKTIVCDNAHAAKPFGTIDTPAQGGDVSGNPYLNFGWVLTPLPKTVPKNGSTIQVFVDSVQLGTLQTAPNVYDQYRSDVSGNFPGLNNTGAPGAGGPVGAYFLNTTGFANGVHTIWWVAYDDQGQGDGIGSRYFNIANTGGSPEPETEPPSIPSRGLSALPISFEPIRIKTGYDRDSEFEPRLPDADGILRVEIPEVSRVEIDLGNGAEAPALSPGRPRFSGHMIVGDEPRPLPIGSTLDRRTGRFSWMPGPGFVGTYDLVFIRHDGTGAAAKVPLRITITPK